ncbi:hypothetical protein Q9L42_020595 (plasmid) [Methylomarinum sp. Ch1-1]|uniref:Uncharacterized protein n=1 Tax=Methylomarinum roseum TaxID=3067653 RepID=A0AAU7P0I9_9GAMM|nr:hypothetical protein [Methylomarinum sp. Ch1-1]MDP4523320.1 hypothetical protein [Methylomarinum sp. Ch1-1]
MNTTDCEGKLAKPNTKYGYIESPKEIIAYLKAGCEIKQIGFNKTHIEGPTPAYWLKPPGVLTWEVRLHEVHVRALETLELITVDSGDGKCWFSRADFSVPSLKSAQDSAS